MGTRQRAVEMGTAISDQSLTVSSTAVGLTVPAGTVSALITNGANAVRLRFGTPTASVGHYLQPYTSFEVFTDDVSSVKLIAVGSDSTAFITFYGA